MKTKLNFFKAAAVSVACATDWNFYSSNQKNDENSANSRQTRAVQRSTAAVQRLKEVKGIPGISVAVTVNGKVAWARGFGYADIEQLSPCTELTVMRIASLSKPITMAIAAKLLENGKLDLDAPLQKYLPDFPEKKFEGQPVTITARNLACHLGGIRHYKAEKGEHSEKDRNEYFNRKKFKSVPDALSMFKDDPIVNKPGTKFEYTTHGYTLLSAVIEGASGKKFEAHLTDLFRNLGMRSTFLDKNAPIIADRAQYYVRKPKGLKNVSQVDNSYKWGGGGLLSNVLDVVKFADVILDSYQNVAQTTPGWNSDSQQTFLKSDTVREMWTPLSKGEKYWYGLGWQIPETALLGEHQGAFVYHGGGAIGATSMLLIRPNTRGNGVCVAILCNLQECNGLKGLAEEIANEFSNLISQ